LNKEDRKASGTYMYKQTQKQNKIKFHSDDKVILELGLFLC